MKMQQMFASTLWTKCFFLFLLVTLPLLIYYPGINGPFIFDDFSNFVSNKSTHIKQLSAISLHEAATSNVSGILGRPIAAISFGLNYYLAGGIDETYGFKLFNITVHAINGLLIFWFTYLCFLQLQKHSRQSFSIFVNKNPIILLAGSCALLWVTHPIQLTSVLYVVQRMTSLATLFILLALISYIQARNAHLLHQKYKAIAWTLTVPIWNLLAIFSKETGFLIPLYIILLEFMLFSNTFPWNHWKNLNTRLRNLIMSMAALIAISLFLAVIFYALPGYKNRDFTLIERLLTEARVLIFYIGQTLIPQLSSFGIFHDDIPISHTLWQPWTTAPAIVLLTSIFLSAFILRKHYPLLSFGILWFFVSHAIESTILPLELIHEHRNYLASLGLVFIIIQCIIWLFEKYNNNRTWMLIPVLLVFFSTTTLVRSHQWKNIYTLMKTQTENHPESHRAWAELARIQFKNNMKKQAILSMTRAFLLDKNEPAYLIKIYLYMESANIRQPETLLVDIDKILILNHQSIPLSNIFHAMTDCIDSTCSRIIPIMEHWIRTVLKVSNSARYEYFLGNILAVQEKYNEALKHLHTSIKLENAHISPYLLIIDIYLMQENIKRASQTYAKLEALSMRQYGLVINEVVLIQNKISKAETAILQTSVSTKK